MSLLGFSAAIASAYLQLGIKSGPLSTYYSEALPCATNAE